MKQEQLGLQIIAVENYVTRITGRIMAATTLINIIKASFILILLWSLYDPRIMNLVECGLGCNYDELDELFRLLCAYSITYLLFPTRGKSSTRQIVVVIVSLVIFTLDFVKFSFFVEFAEWNFVDALHYFDFAVRMLITFFVVLISHKILARFFFKDNFIMFWFSLLMLYSIIVIAPNMMMHIGLSNDLVDFQRSILRDWWIIIL